MFDRLLRQVIDPPLNRVGARLASVGVSANQLTWAGFALGMLCLPLLALQRPGWALVAIVANRIFDGLDGAVARQTQRGESDLGGYLDITLDFLFYSGVVLGFVFLAPETNAVPGAFLIYAFTGTGCSFLAFAVFAAKRGLSTDIRGKKSLYYLGGLTEGAETIAFFVLACLVPQFFPVMAWIFGALCWITTAFRIHAACCAFGKD